MNAEIWREFLDHWPESAPRRGIVVAVFDEQIAFENFLTRGDLALFERRAPDSLGARKVLLPLDQIAAIKIVDPLKTEVFSSAGFHASHTADVVR